MTKEFGYKIVFLQILIAKMVISNIYIILEMPNMFITQVMTYLLYNYYQFVINSN